ncbi:uncharacterized protein LOC141595193 [Silene latifolia]|uniref:uncharacterized protein LOC141595193 n=1 Tax=Silene latifolia TaxID=37657 RepID=UPI003D77B088
MAVKASHNRFSPLFSSHKNSTKSSTNSINASDKAYSSSSGAKVTIFRGPTEADARKTRPFHEINGVPVLDLAEEVETEPTEGWTVMRGGKATPVMDTIIEEEEELTDLLQFTPEDIKPEVTFWNNSVYCYILGANPPWEVVESFVYRVWDEFGIDRVSFRDNGIFIVRFTQTMNMDALLNAGYYLFDNKPVVIKPWHVDTELVKEKIDVVPVWVRLSGIPLKFWGNCLPRIANLVGHYVHMDGATSDKIRLSYARVLVELHMDQKLPDKVMFLDEKGMKVIVTVEYEWRPISCTSCNGIGHDTSQCRKPQKKDAQGGRKNKLPKTKNHPQQVWKPVQKPKPSADLSPPIFTPDLFPPLEQVRATPVVKSTPAKQIIRMNRQGGMVGIRLSGKFSQYTFVDALKSTATPGGGVVESGKDPIDPKRIALWNFLKGVATHCNEPWLWLGDFNTVLSPIERLEGNTTDAEMEHFQECVSLCCMEDLIATGALFTWTNKQETTDRVYSRLDRAMGNLEWMNLFGDYIAHFHPEGLFDHCPCTLVDKRFDIGGRKSFKYFNMWGSADCFKDSVKANWDRGYPGTRMFSVFKKLKALKPVLKDINKHCFSDIENNTNSASLALEQIQKDLVSNPGNCELIQKEMDLASNLRELLIARNSFLSQKAKIQWSLEGDLNTSFFHHTIKKRLMLNKVFQIEDQDGILCTEGDAIQQAFLRYYQELLGTQMDVTDVQSHVVGRGPCCTEAHWAILTAPFTADEIKHSIFSIPNGKSPGPDGFTSQFYKDA